MQKFTDFIHKLLSPMTFRQRFVLFACIFIVCLPLPIYWLMKGQNLYIKSAQSQIRNFNNQKVWNTLLYDIMEYHLAHESGNEEKKEYFNHRVLFDLSAIKNQQLISPKKDLKTGSPNHLQQLWERITSLKDVDSYVHFAQEDRLIQLILEELRVKTLKNESIDIELFPKNQILNFVLCELYHIQIYSIQLITWKNLLKKEKHKRDFYQRLYNISLFRLNKSLESVENYINYNVKFQTFINDSVYFSFIKDTNALSNYLTKLTQGISNTENVFQKAEELLNVNHQITNSLINYGIAYNNKNESFHKMIKYACISLIGLAFAVVIFYLINHVLTSHFLALNEHIKSIAHGRFKECFCSQARDDFGPVGKTFDKLSQTIQNVIGELQRLGRQLTESIKQIAQSANDQNNTFQNDENKIKELEEHTRVIANRTQLSALKMRELSMSVQQNNISEKAKTTIEKMQGMISSLKERSTHIIEHLSTLKSKLEGNKNLFLFLTKVSNQAALLSLNSAIVASNIHQNRQGFLKISDEIKRFADKTASSTDDMKKIVEAIFLSVENIYIDTNKFLNELNESGDTLYVVQKHLLMMTACMQDQTAKFHTVSLALQDQSQTTDQIKKFLDQLAQLAKENGQHTHHLSKTVTKLRTTTEELQIVLNQFFHPKRKMRIHEK